MNHFTWLYILCWCCLLCEYVDSSSIYQAPVSEQTGSSHRREKPLFKIPRISSNTGLMFTHPWQLTPPMRESIHHPMYWKTNSDEEMFLRHKRKLIQMSKSASMPNDQSGETRTHEATTDPSAKTETLTTSSFKGTQLNRNFGSNINSIGFRNKFRSSSQTDKTKIVNKFWNAVYNPLPYGAPRSIQTADEADALRQNQPIGLPVARTASREKERDEKPELRLPIPDSEIPSPGHYRQPVNESLLQASLNPQLRAKIQSLEADGSSTSERVVNVEAFRILMEIIKSLRILNPPSEVTSAKEEFV